MNKPNFPAANDNLLNLNQHPDAYKIKDIIVRRNKIVAITEI